MTQTQFLAFAILAGMMLLFIWGRLRYDVVAMTALLASLAAGTVKPKDAFSGFSDDIVIIIGSALVVSAAVERAGVVETVLGWTAQRVTKIRWQLTVLVGSVTLLSALVKNIGALAMLIPAALKMAKRSGTSPAVFLMPMSFGSLLGGLVTLVGTSPNIIVSRVREQMTGQPFHMFDYAPVGLGLSLAGLIFLRFGYRLIPRDRHAAATMGEALDIADYNTEAEVPPDAGAVGSTIGAFVSANDGAVVVTGMMRGTRRRAITLPDTVIEEGDTLFLRGEPDALERAIAKGGLELVGQDRSAVTDTLAENRGVIEAVVTPQAALIGQAAGRIALHDRHGINLIAISRAGHRMTERLGDTNLAAGDVLVVQGPLDILPERMRELGLLPLAERPIRLGGMRTSLLPVAILVAAMVATATGLVPVAVAFFAAAALMLLTGAIGPREAYDHVEWPILIMLGALIPVSEALRTSGGTDLIATWLSSTAAGLPVWAALGLILVVAMAVTPFLNNAATVLVMAPIATLFAGDLGYRPEAFLMAVAVGAGSDFLTPIGHQCNTLVMGPGGYRFSDYARLGAPLSLIVIIVAVPLILIVWPVH
ncbi:MULTISPECIES: SLC13 family permease [unclassified Sphingomonas]|uniref:SLC13 family permease n=1 Tax=unclassified Sphingomonas TaxID=196159 RepID=UPI0006FE31C1|nr:MULTISPECIES: SLC13 family permease [unclassified Sphingomonas]KQX17845.1 permease [Sphingomonas sp. Root1294]KQY70771.1 permease [Sphingomonas sp. Root50]KRB91736.1 permease [Sphingomonas sp. Root720]